VVVSVAVDWSTVFLHDQANPAAIKRRSNDFFIEQLY